MSQPLPLKKKQQRFGFCESPLKIFMTGTRIQNERVFIAQTDIYMEKRFYWMYYGCYFLKQCYLHLMKSCPHDRGLVVTIVTAVFEEASRSKCTVLIAFPLERNGPETGNGRLQYFRDGAVTPLNRFPPPMQNSTVVKVKSLQAVLRVK